jgi:hypothetical protein
VDIMSTNVGLGAIVMLLAGLFLAPVPASSAEEPLRTPLDSSSARDFMGNWALSIDFNGRPVEMGLKVVDLEGKVGATIDSQQQPEPLAIEDLSIDERGRLVMKYPLQFGQQSFNITLTAALGADGLEGTLEEASGLFNAAFTGQQATDDPEANQQRRRNRRAAGNQARLRFGSESVRVTFHPLKTDSDDFKQFGAMKDGEVFEFIGGRATKLMTDVNLKFADTVVETENAAPDYPGVYSLWLKRSADGWRLVFNEEADIWGTMYNPEANAVEIALAEGPAVETSDTFKVVLEESGNGGVLKLVWGDREWSAPFEVDAAAKTAAATS